jgi:hypothetical protein
MINDQCDNDQCDNVAKYECELKDGEYVFVCEQCLNNDKRLTVIRSKPNKFETKIYKKGVRC